MLCSAKTLIPSQLNPFPIQSHPNPFNSISSPNPSQISAQMYRTLARTIPRSTKTLSSSIPQLSSFMGFPQKPLSSHKNPIFSLISNPQNVEFSTFDGILKPSAREVPPFFSGIRSFASVAEAEVEVEAASSTDADEAAEIQEILEELSKVQVSTSNNATSENTNRNRNFEKTQHRPLGMGTGKYAILRRRQIKIETEAWEQAAKEYKELLADMCERKLAPNLPYVKSLFLGWFEPFRDAILKEQKNCEDPKCKASHRAYFDKLPADMMAVITMHKLMSLLMTGVGDGSVRVVQAACHVGEAIEQEVRIHRFLEKTKKKPAKATDNGDGEVDSSAKEQEIIRKKVTNLMKKHKLHQVRKIVKGQDDCRPWGQEAQAKVVRFSVELFINAVYSNC